MASTARFTDVLGIVIATLAVVLSLVTVLLQRRQQQRDAFRQFHDTLMSPEIQRGRFIVTTISRTGTLPSGEYADLLPANRTLGMYDLLAMYVRHRVVPRRWVLDVWHHPLRDMRVGATLIARHHEQNHLHWTPWPQLWSLFEAAEHHRTSLPCCRYADAHAAPGDDRPQTDPGRTD